MIRGFLGIENPEYSEEIALRRFNKTVKPNGFLYSFVPSSLLWSDRSKTLRDALLLENAIEAIVKLPNGIMPSTNIAVSLVVLKKDRTSTDVKLLDATSSYSIENRKKVLNVEEIVNAYHNGGKNVNFISVNELSAHDSVWDYDLVKLTIPEEAPANYTQWRLDDIGEEIRLRGLKELSNIPILTTTNFSKDFSNYEISSQEVALTKETKDVFLLNEPALVIPRIGKMKPTFCICSADAPMYFTHDVTAYRITNPNVDMGYLCMKLSNLNIRINGVVPNSIPKALLQSLILSFPPLEKQKAQYREAKQTLLMQKAENNGLLELMEKMKSDFIDEIRMRKHDMAPYIVQINSAERRLRKRVETALQNDEDKQFIVDRLDSIASAIKKLSNMMTYLADDTEFGMPKAFDVNNALKDFASNNNGIDDVEVVYEISYASFGVDSEDELPKMMIAEKDFNRLLANIFENAKKHGFSNLTKGERKVFACTLSNKSAQFDLQLSLGFS